MTPDLPGHGSSATRIASLPATAGVLLEQCGGLPMAVGGYSLGGRAALHVAIAAPSVVTGLVLVSTSMGIADEREREERRRRDAELANHIRAIGTERFLTEWLEQPLFAGLTSSERSTRSTNAEGLATSLEHAGVGSQDFLAEAVRHLPMPILVVYGTRDEKYAAIAHDIGANAPTAHIVGIADAGHAVHLEQPDATAAVIAEFLRGLPATTARY